MPPEPSPLLPVQRIVGDRCIRIDLGPQAAASDIAALADRIAGESIAGLVDITPAYTTLLVTLDPRLTDPGAALERITPLLAHASSATGTAPGRLIEIPTCYDADLAPDLAFVAEHAGMTPLAAAALHASAEYRVRFIGFSPGFPYLEGLPPGLAAPRLDSPRPRIAPGSVALAGNQAGIYPLATPGGWRLIGRTPLRLFDAHRAEPALLRAGDRVRFRAISRAEFDSAMN